MPSSHNPIDLDPDDQEMTPPSAETSKPEVLPASPLESQISTK